jgi:hypothetical protein
MNPNDLLAQQQAFLNQALNQQHQIYWVMIVFWFAGLVVTGWVLYMFYARLRDIASELKKLRIAYESSHLAQPMPRPIQRPEVSPPADEHSRYKPKQ